jgi:hypothetical protein
VRKAASSAPLPSPPPEAQGNLRLKAEDLPDRAGAQALTDREPEGMPEAIFVKLFQLMPTRVMISACEPTRRDFSRSFGKMHLLSFEIDN